MVISILEFRATPEKERKGIHIDSIFKHLFVQHIVNIEAFSLSCVNIQIPVNLAYNGYSML